MAQRFGGKYSPKGYAGVAPDRLPETAPSHPMTRRLVWVGVAAVPFLFNAFGGGPVALARGLGGFALVAGAVVLIREGLKAEAAWAARKVARRPALPRKALGAVILGLGLATGAQAPEIGIIGAAVIGMIGAALSLFAFGLDPMRDKGMEGIDPFQQDRVAKVVAAGEEQLAALNDAIARAGDARLTARVADFAQTARKLFRAVEEDPGDLNAARRYMTVYLSGARAAAEKFADLWASRQDAKARADFEALLDDLEANYTARTAQLLEDGREGLEIEIEVLRERLAREGLTPASDHTA
ncbi:5-bromo-4-chloroindolyl phosphate hydrolysis protein [Rhodobacter sp. JA431]|uniref:5-bromo-4-chloroindolyl phosphate hydrolysis family protein n=1 Tax=Rhodobacter sp. JA431 TaxID=570013 RepID=UPI000BCD2E4E|nr:5-bromo-4-chloroindolyl phosphate hydrolysis family protein [Rhodobacter sp. JA431]SOC20063.1 5-bromo-4-chloroindolyl phosphate hydrolysis protein [Rhodobacter sp. JA431]